MKENEKHFVIVNGLGIGEETKGNTVQALVRELNAHTVWRSGSWVGGHHVVHDDGRETVLNHFGAGVFEGADTYLKHMVVSPVVLFQEATRLENLGIPNPLQHILIDQNCLATTPFHSGISRAREILRGVNKKGTIGQGVGEAIKDSSDPELSIRAGEFSDKQTILMKVENIRLAKLRIAEQLIADFKGEVPQEVYPELELLKDRDLCNVVADSFFYISNLVKVVDDNYLQKLLTRGGSIVNEVSHGTLHHPRFGFLPHVTQIDPTSQDVLSSVRTHNYDGSILRIGVVRSYLTRHGAGPLVSFDQKLTDSLPETHNNGGDGWLGAFRTGFFDIVALRYALAIGGGRDSYDGIFVSYMDVLSKRKDWQVVEGYEYRGNEDGLENFFAFENGKIVGIRVHSDVNNEDHNKHQLQLTKLLNECLPVTTNIKATKEMSLEQVFLKYVENKLAVPVVGTGYGPKVVDRHFLAPWQNILKKGR